MTELLIMKAKLKVTITNWEQVSSLILLLNLLTKLKACDSQIEAILVECVG